MNAKKRKLVSARVVPTAGTRSEPQEVINRLAEFGVLTSDFSKAIEEALSARQQTTDHHPATRAGSVTYFECVRSLRDTLVPRGWKVGRLDGLEIVADDERGIQIAYMLGDASTGLPEASPTTKYTKGPAFARAVEQNGRQCCFPWHPSQEPVPLLFFLIVHFTTTEIFCELSLPKSVQTDGNDDEAYRVSDWHERNILPSVKVAPTVNLPRPDDAPDVDVDVRRR